MKVLVIGGNGTIGKTVVEKIKPKHDLIIAGRSSGDHQVDISNAHSISELLDTIGPLDAIINIAGEAKWAPFNTLTEEDYYIGIRSKLMGQVNLTRLGIDHLNQGGSITLSTGILADDPVVQTASAAMVNGAIHSFAKAASLELPRGIRLNVVCLGLVEDAALKYEDYFPGHTPISMTRVANAYVRALEGKGNGQIIREY